MTTVAIHQPHYLPWLGYLAKWAAADVFVFLDTVQYSKNGWQNRNRIKTATGPQWLTVPVHAKLGMGIDEVAVASRPGPPGTAGPSSTPTRARRTWRAITPNSIASMPSRGRDWLRSRWRVPNGSRGRSASRRPCAWPRRSARCRPSPPSA